MVEGGGGELATSLSIHLGIVFEKIKVSYRESPLTPSDIVVKMSGAIRHCRTCLHDFVFIIKHKDNCTLTDEVATQTLLCTDSLLAVTSQKEGFRVTYHFLYLCTVFQYASGALYDPISWDFISVSTLDFFSTTSPMLLEHIQRPLPCKRRVFTRR